MLLWL